MLFTRIINYYTTQPFTLQLLPTPPPPPFSIMLKKFTALLALGLAAVAAAGSSAAFTFRPVDLRPYIVSSETDKTKVLTLKAGALYNRECTNNLTDAALLFFGGMEMVDLIVPTTQHE